eukprot:TRINITY_DN2555_c0_g1_i7.p1 TRINITY_DN2555_c0_g1~~TRINITY_DN2555_c0_g1_i7.p1  ORF type:complete len:1049 (-),score=252.77 TRINITY_DN2555_c0_g1_i7:182-3328(-)
MVAVSSSRLQPLLGSVDASRFLRCYVLTALIASVAVGVHSPTVERQRQGSAITAPGLAKLMELARANPEKAESLLDVLRKELASRAARMQATSSTTSVPAPGGEDGRSTEAVTAITEATENTAGPATGVAPPSIGAVVAAAAAAEEAAAHAVGQEFGSSATAVTTTSTVSTTTTAAASTHATTTADAKAVAKAAGLVDLQHAHAPSSDDELDLKELHALESEGAVFQLLREAKHEKERKKAKPVDSMVRKLRNLPKSTRQVALRGLLAKLPRERQMHVFSIVLHRLVKKTNATVEQVMLAEKLRMMVDAAKASGALFARPSELQALSPGEVAVDKAVGDAIADAVINQTTHEEVTQVKAAAQYLRNVGAVAPSKNKAVGQEPRKVDAVAPSQTKAVVQEPSNVRVVVTSKNKAVGQEPSNVGVVVTSKNKAVGQEPSNVGAVVTSKNKDVGQEPTRMDAVAPSKNKAVGQEPEKARIVLRRMLTDASGTPPTTVEDKELADLAHHLLEPKPTDNKETMLMRKILRYMLQTMTTLSDEKQEVVRMLKHNSSHLQATASASGATGAATAASAVAASTTDAPKIAMAPTDTKARWRGSLHVGKDGKAKDPPSTTPTTSMVATSAATTAAAAQAKLIHVPEATTTAALTTTTAAAATTTTTAATAAASGAAAMSQLEGASMATAKQASESSANAPANETLAVDAHKATTAAAPATKVMAQATTAAAPAAKVMAQATTAAAPAAKVMAQATTAAAPAAKVMPQAATAAAPAATVDEPVQTVPEKLRKLSAAEVNKVALNMEKRVRATVLKAEKAADADQQREMDEQEKANRSEQMAQKSKLQADLAGHLAEEAAERATAEEEAHNVEMKEAAKAAAAKTQERARAEATVALAHAEVNAQRNVDNKVMRGILHIHPPAEQAHQPDSVVGADGAVKELSKVDAVTPSKNKAVGQELSKVDAVTPSKNKAVGQELSKVDAVTPSKNKAVGQGFDFVKNLEKVVGMPTTTAPKAATTTSGATTPKLLPLKNAMAPTTPAHTAKKEASVTLETAERLP